VQSYGGSVVREVVIRSLAEVHINSTLNIQQSDTDNDILRVSIIMRDIAVYTVCSIKKWTLRSL